MSRIESNLRAENYRVVVKMVEKTENPGQHWFKVKAYRPGAWKAFRSVRTVRSGNLEQMMNELAHEASIWVSADIAKKSGVSEAYNKKTVFIAKDGSPAL